MWTAASTLSDFLRRSEATSAGPMDRTFLRVATEYAEAGLVTLGNQRVAFRRLRRRRYNQLRGALTRLA